MSNHTEFVSHLHSNAAVKDINHDKNGYRERIQFTICTDELADGERANIQKIDWHKTGGPYDCWPISESELKVVVIP